MGTLANTMTCLPSCLCRRQGDTESDHAQPGLRERYRQADEHYRLCLWLQFREARPQMDVWEADLRGRPPRTRTWLERLLGLPRLG